MPPPVVLGPQRPSPNVPLALAELARQSEPRDGPIVVLTAGWRTDETDDEALRRHLGPDVAVLPVYTWFEVVMRELPELRAEYRARQDALVDLRRLHRMRLNPALGVVTEFLRAGRDTAGRDPGGRDTGSPVLVEEHLQLAFDDVRRIDRQLLDSAGRIHAAHARASEPWTAHPVVERLRTRAVEALTGARAIAIAGGHVAVLLNRLQFFGLDRVLRELGAAGRPIVAWSAGSMVLTDRIVLFYDDPPDGPAYPELLDLGFGMVNDVVVLPHARLRLRLDDPIRVSALANRFGPSPCIGLENGAWLVRDADAWYNRGAPGTAVQLLPDGTVRDLPAWGRA
ncbi:MAG: Type 1 glutamine amidotransferase-like domain-containing protein [Myxococcota bacterium]